MIKKTIGIIGGMGPEATLDLFREIINVTPAKKDQDHIPILIDNNTQIPDRTEAILYGGKSPVNELLVSAKRLESLGCNLLLMPCNTSHFFIEELREQINIPFINMIEETAYFIKKNYPSVKNIGLLATTGTVELGIYRNFFNKINLNIISLDSLDQEYFVMRAIYGPKGIKAGNKVFSKKLLSKAIELLSSKGSELIILGCTELPLVLKQKDFSKIFINPTIILAKAAVDTISKLSREEQLVLEKEK